MRLANGICAARVRVAGIRWALGYDWLGRKAHAGPERITAESGQALADGIATDDLAFQAAMSVSR